MRYENLTFTGNAQGSFLVLELELTVTVYAQFVRKRRRRRLNSLLQRAGTEGGVGFVDMVGFSESDTVRTGRGYTTSMLSRKKKK